MIELIYLLEIRNKGQGLIYIFPLIFIAVLIYEWRADRKKKREEREKEEKELFKRDRSDKK